MDGLRATELCGSGKARNGAVQGRPGTRCSGGWACGESRCGRITGENPGRGESAARGSGACEMHGGSRRAGDGDATRRSAEEKPGTGERGGAESQKVTYLA